MKRRSGIGVILLLLTLVISAVAVQEYRQYEKQRKEYEEKASFYRRCMQEEQSWIRSQQAAEGVICLYQADDTKVQSVIPYFSCQAAIGLLTGDVEEENLRAAGDYLAWQTRELIRCQGILSDYEIRDGRLRATDSYDSVDSYLALYLTLLATYAQKGGNPSEISDVETAVMLCVRLLDELTVQGLTKVSEEADICYLMDNLEVKEAYEKMDALMQSGHEGIRNWKNYRKLHSFFEKSKVQIKDAIRMAFWQKNEKKYAVAVDKNGQVLAFEEKAFYPGAVAQVYSLACGESVADEENERRLYEDLCGRYAWVTMNMDTTFEWPVMSYIAMQLYDVESAERYLSNYRRIYGSDRSYPYKVADAGWTARAYEKLYEYYDTKAKRDLKEIIKAKWKNEEA